MSASQIDWSLHRKGPVDQARHDQKIKEAIRDNLAEIISEESIITSDGKRTIKVPVRSLEEYRFRFDPAKRERFGQGDGGTQAGDVIAKVPAKGPGKGRNAGDQPGVDYFEAEITIDELAELIFADLGLPNLRPKAARQVPSERIEWTDVRKQGAMPNLDKRRTVLENIRRNARQGDPVFRDLTRDDLRFRTWQQRVRREHNAVIIAMRDVSGSMGEFKKYISRSLFFWMVRFLRTRYNDVDIVFVAHHTEAREVSEEDFFKLGESGGTKVSSAYQLAHDIIRERYDPGVWNVYPFHFSDGDNWGEADNRRCLELVRRLLEVCSLFGYGEIREGGYTSTLMSAFSQIDDPRFVTAVITERKDVYPALKKFFRSEGELP